MEVEPETGDTPPSTTNITSDPASTKSKLSETKRSPRELSLNKSTESNVRRQSPRAKTTSESVNDTTSTEPLIVVGGRRGRKSITPTLRASTTPSLASPSEAVLVKKSRKEKSRAELDVSSTRYEVSI